MSTTTSIEWTDVTWNPVRGCSRVSAGCDNCYAIREANRHRRGAYADLVTIRKRDGEERADWTGKAVLVPDALDAPLHWQKPRRVFVNSMSDLFHESLPDHAIDRVFEVMALARRHVFQVLTKRPSRMRSLVPTLAAKHTARDSTGWPLPNVWLGVSCEDQATADERIPLLLQTPAAVRFVSAEPLLGAVDLRVLQPGDPPTEIDALAGTHGVLRPHRGECDRLDWVIVGGESGPRARRCDVRWIRSIVEQCKAASVSVFVKQLGARPRFLPGDEATGYEGIYQPLDLASRKGGDPSEWPEDVRVREFPR